MDTRKEIRNVSRRHGDSNNEEEGLLLDDTAVDNETLRILANDDKIARESPGICQVSVFVISNNTRSESNNNILFVQFQIKMHEICKLSRILWM